MARIKLIPDDVVFTAVLQILLDHGEKSVTFAAVSEIIGLAPATLVQRFGTCGDMILQALTQAWDGLDRLVATALSEPTIKGKGVTGLLKALTGPVNSARLLTLSARDATLIDRGVSWREGVEAALIARLGTSPKAKETAALIFATWQGRLLWDVAGGKGFRLGEAIKRLV
jgi:hypothetical protein